MDQTGYTQPVMFSIEYALACLWRSWGVEPAAVMGHSVGEFAAACVAGVFSLEDGLRLIAQRARLMQALPPGGLMAAVFAAEEQVRAALESCRDQVTIAAFNGPANIVISGDEPAVRDVLSRLERDGIKSKTLATSHAFHSHRMEPMLDQLRRAAESVRCSPPRIDIISNLTGQGADQGTFADPGYWSRHARSPVRFAESIRAMAALDCELFLEIGPSPTLIGMGQRCLPGEERVWLPSLRSGRDDWQTLLSSLAELYVRGVNIDWAGFDRDYRRQKIELPSYPFQRRRYWAFAEDEGPHSGWAPRRNRRALHPLLGSRVVAATSEYVFESQLAANRPTTLGDHKIQGLAVMPAAGYLEMALAASAAVYGKPWTVCGATLVEPLLLEKTPKTIQTVVSCDGHNTAAFRIVSVAEPDGDGEPSFTPLAIGRLESPCETPPAVVDLAAVRSHFVDRPHDEAWRIQALGKSGLEPGPTFRWMIRHWVNERGAVADVRRANDADRPEDYQVHPGLLDSAFQLLGGALPGAGEGIDAYVPMSVDRIEVLGRPLEAAWFVVTLRSHDGKLAVGDIQVTDTEGRVLVKMEGVRLHRVPRDWLARRLAGPLPDWCYDLAWAPQPLDATALEQTATGPGQWLVFDCRDRLGAALAERLEIKGHRCTLVEADGDAEARGAAVRDFLGTTEAGRRGVVYLSGLDADGRQAAPDFAAARQCGWGGALDVVRALAESSDAEPPRLWLVTRGAQTVDDSPRPLCLAQSPIWGMGRVIASEHPALRCTRIDLDPEDRRDAADQLVEELWSGQGEDQIAYRDGRRRVVRLRRLKHSEADVLETPNGHPYQLEITTRGQLDNVALRPLQRRRPGPGQVEIRVRATGLNFRDVLNVMDLYPGDPGPLGGECAGEITAIGEGVEHLRPGDQVVAFAPASFASYAVTLAEFVAPKPKHLTFDEAATIPICFATAQHALRRLANVQPGERVLIHAASGGVGLAAIQIARQIGAEIFATAGSPRKRDYLKSLGIEHVMDSRLLDFAPQIMKATGGEGVDAVVNSLTGDSIAASLSVLRPGGRFLELGKTDLWDQCRVNEFKPGIRFYPIALDGMMARQPESVRELLGEVLPQFIDKKLEPLPLRAFRIQQTIHALRHMARAEHIGKVVIQAALRSNAVDHGLVLREEGTYMVTGGLGGLGLKLARWLADRGARHLVLVGRSGASAQARPELEAMRKSGIQVIVRQCDVGSREQIAALLTDIRDKTPPLRGIFHLAGVLDDGILREQTRERFDRVMAAKAIGAWNLHDLTREEPLDMFVLFSSAAALLGSPGQGNYAAANAFLDALAHHRRWEKRPALSVNWGSWAEVGMAARLIESEGRRWSAAGIHWIEPLQGLQTLENLIIEDRVQAGVLPIDWPKFFDRIPQGSEPAWLTEMARDARAAAPAVEAAKADLLEEAAGRDAGRTARSALSHIRKQAARVLAIEETNLPDPRRTLNELGFDSLTAVEFANRVGRSIGRHLNPSLLFDYPTLESLAGYVVGQVRCRAGGGRAGCRRRAGPGRSAPAGGR